MADFTFATLRLGKTSVEEIKRINTKAGGASTEPFPISVVCTQIPTDLDIGVIVFIWLGSDNSKGMATEWKQGFKAIGRVTSVVRGEKYNDESTTEVEVFYVFPNAINRLDILRDAAADYYRCSSMPIIGLDDHSNQTIRMLESGELSDTNAFFSALNCVYGNFSKELLEIDSRFAPMFWPSKIKGDNFEEAFKSWLAGLVRSNGVPYTANTRNQYISALKSVSNQFADAIAPFASIFEITDADVFERAVLAIKADSTYEEFNRSRSNGSLSAGLVLYKRFLLEKDNDTRRMFTPEWFREKAAEYPTLDMEASKLLGDFQKKFSPEYLTSLSGVEMLNTIFLNAANTENVCRVLEFGPQIKDTFGSIKGGNAYKYGLYYSTQGAWMTGSHQKPRQLTEEEAIEVGAKLRDHLVAGANAIKEYGQLATIDDYKKLHEILRDVTEGDIERVWFLKYYQMLYPELFATNYSDYAQRTVLNAIGEEKEKYALVRMGQIRFYANKCGISNVMFNKIFWEYYSEEAVAEEADADTSQGICFNTGYYSEYPRNRILFGAPGTGKSFTLNREKDQLLANGGEYERVTFHPDYSYANFVGTYKPVPCKDSDGKDVITYSYVPGPFMRTYVKALQNSRTDAPKPFLLVIEEINRANVAAVFGDVFQLLDRGDDEVSEYPIQASEDIKKYLAGELGGNPDDYAEIRIPDNMFIWATMNSADQGVFPMDTAFKRRWDFTYLGIDDSEAGIVGKKVILGQGDYRRIVEWNALRKAINNELLTYKVNEDKLMGPYFISKKNLPEGEMIDPTVFTRIFKNKVIMYLFDDAAKQKRITLFGGCDEKAKNQYSKICREFDTKGVYIFCEGISSQFIDNVPEDDGE